MRRVWGVFAGAWCALALAGCNTVDGNQCTVVQNADGSATIECLDGSSATVAGGAAGTNGADGAGCTAEDNGDGTFTLTCGDSEPLIVSEGRQGEDGTSCSVTDNGDGAGTISCDDGTSVVVSDGATGADGTSCTAVDNGDGSSTITCPDGTSLDYATCGGVTGTFSNLTMNGVSGSLAGGDAVSGSSDVTLAFDYELSTPNVCSGCDVRALVVFYSEDLGYFPGADFALNATPNNCDEPGAVSGSVANAVASVPPTSGLYEVRLVVAPSSELDALRAQLPFLYDTSVGDPLGTVEVTQRVCSAGSIFAEEVRFDGVAGRRATVAPGATVELTADFTNVKSSCSGCAEFVAVGIPGQRFGCLSGGTSACPGRFSDDLSFTFTAPAEPGFYPLVFRRGLVFNCTDVSLSNGQVPRRFAVLEVAAP